MTQTYCTKCMWIHEADSTKGTSFMGVGLCPKHAAAPDLLEACKEALRIIQRDNCQSVSIPRIIKAISKAEGRE